LSHLRHRGSIPEQIRNSKGPLLADEFQRQLARATEWNTDCLSQKLMPEFHDLPKTVRRAIHEIVQYMAQHPEARDTLSGIRDWWLPPGSSYTSVELQEALDTLTAWGWLVKYELVKQTVVYGVAEAALDRAKEFLRETTDQES
jgi:hypothetical protein